MLFDEEEQRAIEYAVKINSDLFYSRFSRTSTRLLHPIHKDSYMKYLSKHYTPVTATAKRTYEKLTEESDSEASGAPVLNQRGAFVKKSRKRSNKRRLEQSESGLVARRKVARVRKKTTAKGLSLEKVAIRYSELTAMADSLRAKKVKGLLRDIRAEVRRMKKKDNLNVPKGFFSLGLEPTYRSFVGWKQRFGENSGETSKLEGNVKPKRAGRQTLIPKKQTD